MSEIDVLQGWNLAAETENDNGKALAEAAQIMRRAVDLPHFKSVPEHKADGRTRFLQGTSEFVASLAAGIAGAVVWGAAGSKARAFGAAGTVGLAMGAGGVVKYSVKSALEHILLKPEDRTVSKADLAWGTIDGLSGITGSLAEQAVSKRLLASIGHKALGRDVSESLAKMGGEKIVAQELLPKIKLNLVRGLSGGAAGSFTWSVPHRLYESREEIAKDPLAGLNKVKSEVINDTLFGTVLGGGISAGGTALFNGAGLFRRGFSSLTDEGALTKLDLAHINDHHSELVGSRGLARMVTKVDELRAESAAAGRTHEFVNAGDLESGNVVFAFTKGGWVENEAMARAGEKIRIPGNHPYDVAGGGSDVGRYEAVMKRVMSDHPDINLLAANLDLSAYPDFAKLTKPYMTIDVKGPGGVEKVGIIGLITEEGAVSKIKYQDPVATAERYISELHDQGIKKILVLSHQGLAQDISLAKRVKGITAIIGGHSHDIEPTPRWIRQGADSLSFWQKWNPFHRSSDPFGGWEVPIVQAGSNGRWVGELNLAMRASGAADRYRTAGRLHPITKEIPADREIEQFITSNIGELNALRTVSYNSEAVAPYSLSNIRNRETALGNLVSDATAWGVRKQLGKDSVDLVLTHSGGIRAGINAHDPITRFDLSNVFINAGNPIEETREMVLLAMTGREIKNTLEFGVHDLGAAGSSGGNMLQRVHRFMASPQVGKYADQSGYFLQVSDDLKYSFDLSKQPRIPGETSGNRISDVLIKGKDGQFRPIDDTRVYQVLTRYHEAEKWFNFGTLDNGADFDDALRLGGARPVEYSRVEFTGDYIRNRTLDPAVDGRVGGRITDLSPKPWQPRLYPGLSLVSYSSMSGAYRWAGNDDSRRQPGFFK